MRKKEIHTKNFFSAPNLELPSRKEFKIAFQLFKDCSFWNWKKNCRIKFSNKRVKSLIFEIFIKNCQFRLPFWGITYPNGKKYQFLCHQSFLWPVVSQGAPLKNFQCLIERLGCYMAETAHIRPNPYNPIIYPYSR